MTDKLADIVDNLTSFKVNLSKLNYDKRKPEILSAKLVEANAIHTEFRAIVRDIHDQIEKNKLQGQCLVKIQSYCDKIQDLYKWIQEFCSVTYTSSNSSGVRPISDASNTIMEEFNLKVALSLIPVMTDDEDAIEQLINSIEYYDSILKTESKQSLINFVLKNRLTKMAKLKLSQTYTSVENMVKDMKKNLLTKKSAFAIQNQMQILRQGDSTIDDFGKQLADMFVNLTIAQSEGNSSAFDVLKKVNEKQAIKKFADGLRNRRISTIIAAREYNFLKDAVQGAKDEETAAASSSGEMLSFNPQFYNNYSRGYVRGRGQNYRGPAPSQYRGVRFPQAPARAARSDAAAPPGPSSGTYRYRPSYYRGGRGRYFHSQTNNGYDHQNVRVFNEQQENDTQSSGEVRVLTDQYDGNNVTPMQFFRE